MILNREMNLVLAGYFKYIEFSHLAIFGGDLFMLMFVLLLKL
jgi:hypothetical protein